MGLDYCGFRIVDLGYEMWDFGLEIKARGQTSEGRGRKAAIKLGTRN